MFLSQGCFRKEADSIRGLMSDEEWACFEPFVTMRGAHSGRRPKINYSCILAAIISLPSCEARCASECCRGSRSCSMPV